jgi:hypothetical protein
MPIYSGNTPPNIEGTYSMSPCVLVYDSNNAFNPGYKFTDIIIEFTNQNMTQNTLVFRDEYVDNSGNPTNTSTKSEAKIIGSGNDFTIFVIAENNGTNGSWTKLASLYSGTITNNGIKNFHEGFVMLDKIDPDNNLMKVGQFRIVNDQDGMSDTTTWKARQRAARIKDGKAKIQFLPLPIDAGPTGLKNIIDLMEEVSK